MTQLIKYEAARHALTQAVKFDEVMAIKDTAERMALYARQAQDTDLIEKANEIKLRAERRAGQMLAEAAKQGQRATTEGNVNQYKKRVSPESTPTPVTLDEIGISRNESSRWQKLASISDEEFEKKIEAGNSATEMLRSINHTEKIEAVLPDGKYRIIYADPPWRYGNSGEVVYGNAEDQYPTMSIAELCELDIKKISHDDAVLFLWVTSPLLAECFDVIKTWGFQYKSSFVWDKDRHNFGFYNSVQHEFLLICTRGSCTPDIDEKIPSVQTIKRTGKHSEKPEEFRIIIDKLYPTGKRIELFSRKNVEGWEAFGNEPDTSRIAG